MPIPYEIEMRLQELESEDFLITPFSWKDEKVVNTKVKSKKIKIKTKKK